MDILPNELIYKILVLSKKEFYKFARLSKRYNNFFENYKNELAVQLLPEMENEIDTDAHPEVYKIAKIINQGFIKSIKNEFLTANIEISKLSIEDQLLGLMFISNYYYMEADDECVYLAIKYNCIGVLQWIIDAYSGDIICIDFDYKQHRALVTAIESNYDDLFKYLLSLTDKYRINIEVCSSTFITLVENDRMDLIQYVVDNNYLSDFTVEALTDYEFLYITLKNNNLDLFEYIISIYVKHGIEFDNSHDIAQCYYESYMSPDIGVEYFINVANKYNMNIDKNLLDI